MGLLVSYAERRGLLRALGNSPASERGQTLLEYALIIAFIGMGAIAAMWALGPAIGDAFQVVTDTLSTISF